MNRYLTGSAVIVGDYLPCGPGARDKGSSQLVQLFSAYNDAPPAVKQKWHAQVFGIQESWNRDVGSVQAGTGWANCNARDLGIQAEQVRAQIADESRQGSVAKASEKSIAQELAEGTRDAAKTLVPWWAWVLGGVAIVGGVAIFVGPSIYAAISAVTAARAARRAVQGAGAGVPNKSPAWTDPPELLGAPYGRDRDGRALPIYGNPGNPSDYPQGYNA